MTCPEFHAPQDRPIIARPSTRRPGPPPLIGLTLFVVFGVLSGCRLTPSIEGFREVLANHPDQGRFLERVPFEAQAPEHCAQAALASVISFHGKPVSLQDLSERSFMPALHATPTFALVEEARRRGFATREYESVDLAALLLWLDAGMPVITLRRPRPSIIATLHYDVLVGYDDEAGLLVRHDGTSPFQVVAYERFMAEWTGWALVLIPAEMVAGAEQAENAARSGRVEEARLLYRRYLRRFPADLTAAFNLADLVEPDEAARIYEAILRLDPDDGPTLNNLADLLGRTRAGHERAECLLEHAIEVDPANAAAYRRTLAEVRRQEEAG